MSLADKLPLAKRILAKNVEFELETITDRVLLDAIKWEAQSRVDRNRHHKLGDFYKWAVQDLDLVKQRIAYLDRYTVKTPPITPQLNLFQ